MKINLLIFIQDLVIKKRFMKYNINVILIKTSLAIEMADQKNYKKANLCIYQQLKRKLMYLVCGIRPDIIFVVA